MASVRTNDDGTNETDKLYYELAQAWRKNIELNDQNGVWDDQNQFGTPLGDLNLGTSLDARELEI